MKTLRFIIPFLACSLTGTAANPDHWTNLFNGHNLAGWRVLGGGATFTVEGGAIVGHNGPGHNTFLATNHDYADFELEFDVKLSSPLNSGVQIRAKIRPEKLNGAMVERVYGPQVEIELSPGEAGYVFGERAGGWLTPADELIPHHHFISGEWNHYRVVARGPRIQTWINGTRITDIAPAATFKEHAQGFIGLQVHQTDQTDDTLSVAWRNIRVKKLPANKSP